MVKALSKLNEVKERTKHICWNAGEKGRSGKLLTLTLSSLDG